MSENQSGKPEKKKTNSGRLALIGATATALAIFNMWPGGEAPSQAVAILQWIFLAGGLIGLGGALVMFLSAE
jgi:hypothetical protein